MSDQEVERKLAREAADIEQQWERGEEDPAPLYRNRPRRGPSLLYNLRMPASRLEQLRQLADRAGVRPSTLMRQWVIERLDQETEGDVSPDPRVQQAVRLELERVGLGDEGEAMSLMEALRVSVELAREARAAEVGKQGTGTGRAARPSRRRRVS